MPAASEANAMPPAAATADAAVLPPLPPPPARALVAGWTLFWLLMVTVAVQDHVRQGSTGLWKPLLWEGSSCLVASAIAWALWHRIARSDALLPRPWRWFAAQLVPLPALALAFVAATYGLRHGVHALAGEPYVHDPWVTVLRYESVKFALFYALFAAIVFGLRSHAWLTAERLRAERARALAQRAQLLQLAQQIEPHFLFNALNTIAAVVHTDAALAETLLMRLSALLRAATDMHRQPLATLDDELRLLDAYTAIMCERFAGRVTLRLAIDAEARPCRIPTLSLQPLVENAFRHGVERRAGPATIVVAARRVADRLCIEVGDDAGDLPEAPVFGVGLANLRERLALGWGAQATLTLAPRSGGGALVRMELPCAC